MPLREVSHTVEADQPSKTSRLDKDSSKDDCGTVVSMVSTLKIWWFWRFLAMRKTIAFDATQYFIMFFTYFCGFGFVM